MADSESAIDHEDNAAAVAYWRAVCDERMRRIEELQRELDELSKKLAILTDHTLNAPRR